MLELLVAMAVAAVVLGIAVPSFSSALSHHQLVVASNTLQRAMLVARQTAITQNVPVTFCAGNPAVGCHGRWSEQEWLVFVDRDRDATLNDGDTVVSVTQPLKQQKVMLSANGPFKKAVVFHPTGRAVTVTGAFAAGALRVCVARSFTHNANDLVLIGSGRAVLQQRDFAGQCPALGS